MARRHASTISGTLKRPFDQQVQFFRQKLGNLVPTDRWDDIQREARDRSFWVAGATKADLLTDLAAAMDRPISEGKSIGAFRKDFRAIAERRGWHGWTGEGTKHGELWRTRVIYTTNMSTAYAAGRYQQLREAGFDQWIYKHSGAAEPRPQHLAWDGLTLPADHPFWDTHGPKNGWGCECYVVGARSDRGAKRLGGDPDKPLPDDWDTIDPKTGAPVGIDRGWDYQPGQRAANIPGLAERIGQVDPQLQDLAVAMAEKANASWPYDIATAYMRGVPTETRDALAIAYRSLPSVATDTRLYAQRILEGRTHLEIPEVRTLGLATRKDVRRIADSGGPDVAGMDFAIDRSAVGHIQRNHGDEAIEAGRGQRAVTAADYQRLPGLLNDYAAEDLIVSTKKTGAGLSAIEIRSRYDEEEWVSVWEVRGGRRRHNSLTLKSLSIKVGRE